MATTVRARILVKVPMELLLPAEAGEEGRVLKALLEGALVDFGIEVLQVRYVGAGLTQLRTLREEEAASTEDDPWEEYYD